MKQKFYITGMTCSACSAFIEKTISKLDGVSICSVSLVSNSMIVEYNSDICSDNIIMMKVKEIGYIAKLEKVEIKKIDKTKIKLIISLIFLVLLMYVSMGHMLGLPIFRVLETPNSDNLLSGFYLGLIQLFIVIPIICLNFGYFIRGVKHLIKGNPNMDTLIAIGSIASIIYGIVTIIKSYVGALDNNLEIVKDLYHQYYFESAGSILTFVSIGKYIEGRSKKKTTDAISNLINLTPKEVMVKDGDNYKLVNVEDVVVNSLIMIKPGDVLAVDGEIIEGVTNINAANLTGESIPIYKQVGDIVLAGTINLTGNIIIKATHTYEDSSVSKIVKLVEEASNSKMPISRLIDKVSIVFVPTVILISILTATIWFFIDKNMIFNHAIAVLVISCPCALGLATPLAIMVSTGSAAKKGILIRNSASLEILKDVKTVVFDKTGTLTVGKLNIKEIKNKNIEYQEFIDIVYSIEKNSNHPLAISICEKLEKDINKNYEFTEIKELPGYGMVCKMHNDIYYVGNVKLLRDNFVNVDDEIESIDYTKILVARNQEFLGVITFEDVIKKQSYNLIKTLKKLGLKTVLLSGDNEKIVKKIQKQLDMDLCFSEALPDQKRNVIVELQKEGKVLMVGDGINDAVALTIADVGIAVASGTDIAIDSADIVIIGDELNHISESIIISKKTISVIKLNLFWAFIYNALCIPVAAGVLSRMGINISPMIGSLMMSLSSLCVVFNSLRLRRIKSINEIGEKKMKKVIIIEGMMCKHCQKHVEDALNSIVGMDNVVVDLISKSATVDCSESITNEMLEKAVVEAGYIVVEIK